MSQGSTVIPTTGTQSGLAIAQAMNAALNAVLTQSSGSSAPTNGSAGTPDKGQPWLDTSVTPNALRMWDGGNWVVKGYLDSTNHVWDPPIGGGVATINSATTTDIWANPASTITVNGTATITQFASADAVPGTIKLVKAGAAFTMTHDATKLILPTGQPVTVSPGDSFFVFALDATNVQVMGYTKTDGTSLVETGIFTQGVFFIGLISPSALSSSQNDWNPTGVATANTIRLSASSAVNITGIVAPTTDGKIVIVHNVGTNAVTLTANSSSSSSANRFKFTHDVTLEPNQSKAIIYDLTSAMWRQLEPTGAKASTTQVFSASGSGTYTTPAGVRWLKVRMTGGGGGGGGNGNPSGTGGGNGGSTVFNGVTANPGGGGASNASGVPGNGGSPGNSGTGTANVRLVGATGGQGVSLGTSQPGIGGCGGGGPFGAGAEGNTSSGASSSSPGSGGAGGGTLGATNITGAGGGGAGEYVELIVTNPASTLSYIVGAAGSVGGTGSGGVQGGNGQGGVIIVEEFYD